MTDNKLMPCPFCGEGNSQVSCYMDDYNFMVVGCGRCGCHSGRISNREIDATERVINLWNTRADLADLAALTRLAELEKVAEEMAGALQWYHDISFDAGEGDEWIAREALAAYRKLKGEKLK